MATLPFLRLVWVTLELCLHHNRVTPINSGGGKRHEKKLPWVAGVNLESG